MRVHGSPFLRIELLLTLLAFPLVAAGCGPRQVWGVPAEELRGRLAQGDYEALAAVAFPSDNPEESLALEPQAPYYLSFVFDGMGLASQSLTMLELAWSRSPSPWKEQAGALLAQRYNEQKDWDKAAAVARRVLASPGSPGVEQGARRALVEALYWQKDDAAALAEAARLSDPDPEVLLFRAVSSLRLGLAPAHDLVMQLFLEERTSPLHARFATFLAGEPGFQPLFPKPDQEVISARAAMLQGAWSTALPLLEDALEGPDAQTYAHTSLLMDMGNAYIAAGRSAAGAAFMQRLSGRLTGQARADALEQAGRLYRRARDYARAQPLLRTVAEQAPTLDQRDRARWFILDILMALSPPDLAARVREEAGHWNDPSYFADVLEDRIAGDVAARRWSLLDALRRALEGRGPDRVQAELDYIVARAWQLGRVRLQKDVTAADLFSDAARRDPAGYYGILSASMLGRSPDLGVAGTAPAGAGGQAALDPLAMGFLSYGLTDEAYARLAAQRAALSDALILAAARRFAAAGDLRSSQYLMTDLARRRGLTAEEMDLYYPKGYAALLEPLASASGIPFHFLYGMVREESFFDAEVVSSAGAVGLTQLMPGTAEAVGRTLRMAAPDLRDPATNLAIGVRHLQNLLHSVGGEDVKALLAYNAGLSRLRQWERAGSSLPDDLLVESVPIAETRGYVRKIFVSSVMYAYLYGDEDPRAAALSFFGIRPGPLEPDPRRSDNPAGAS